MITSRDRLYFFTHAFPYGLGEEWKYAEILELQRHFDVTVIPMCNDGQPIPRPLPEGVDAERPLIRGTPTTSRVTQIARVATSRHIGHYLAELAHAGAYKRRAHFAAWLETAATLATLCKTATVRHFLEQHQPDDVLYWHWGRGTCDLMAMLDIRSRVRVVRFHRYDLYEDEVGGYIPFRRELLDHLTLAAVVSEHGAKYLRERYPDASPRIRHLPLGTRSAGLARASTDGVLRLVSCARVVPVKRLHILVEALSRVSIPVEWTHIGDGALLSELQSRAAALPSHVQTCFRGRVKPWEVAPLYASSTIDLFVNVSASEGVPVSVMEALAAGVPVAATDVGGTGEIIDNEVGALLPAALTPSTLANYLADFAETPPRDVARRRSAAFARYQSRCDATTNARALCQVLLEHHAHASDRPGDEHDAVRPEAATPGEHRRDPLDGARPDAPSE